MHICDLCGLEFSRKDDLITHIKSVHKGFSHKCNFCEKVYNRKDILKRHQNQQHIPSCGSCGRSSTSIQDLELHQLRCKPRQRSSTKRRLSSTNTQPNASSTSTGHPATTSSEQSNFLSTQEPVKKKRKHRKILGDTARTYVLPRSSPPLDIYLESQRSTLSEEISDMLKIHHGVLFYITIQILYVRPDNWVNNGLDIDRTTYHSSNTLRVLTGSDLQELIDETFQSILIKAEVFLRDGSGWVIDEILPSELFIGAYQPLHQEDESD